MSDIDISVVIPVKNGERYIESVLKAVFSQKSGSNFEVIIIDSGSKDKTLDIIKNYPISLYQVKEEDFNHGLTRNLGISKALGRYVILLTQDAIPCDKRWMERLVNNLERDGSIAGVYSRQVARKDSVIFTQFRVSRFFTSKRERGVSQIEDIETYNKLQPLEKYIFCNFDNVSSCIRKATWENFKFQKTEFGEDIEWSKRVLEAGYKIVYEPDSAVCHSHDYSVRSWYQRNIINYKRLHAIFGVNGMDNFYKLLARFFIYAAGDFKSLGRFYVDIKDMKAILLVAPLIPMYSFAGALGQYMGINKRV